MTKTRIVLDENGDEIEIIVPCHWEICGLCRGNGKHSHDLGAITSSEWEEWDYDERDTYMSGGYDRTCEDCNGSGKIQSEDCEAYYVFASDWHGGQGCPIYRIFGRLAAIKFKPGPLAFEHLDDDAQYIYLALCEKYGIIEKMTRKINKEWLESLN